MKKQLTFLELACKVLEEEKIPLSASEIWNIAVSKEYDKLINSEGKTPWATLNAQVYVNAKKTESPFVKIGARPVRFYLKSLKCENINLDLTELEKKQIKKEKSKKFEYLEKDLHPIMAYFGRYYLSAYLKTIDHKTSNKKSYGEWLHPDMVGCYFPFEEWNEEIYSFNKAIGNIPIKLYSFEIKRELTFNNIRESFFQAVSNSSWANEGYLVASEIAKEEEFISELKRLSLAYGIGIIELDIHNPDSSQILYPAEQKENLDWETTNKIVELNPEFKKFISDIVDSLQIKKVIEGSFDKIRDIEDLVIAK